jgi:hypothetical protein
MATVIIVANNGRAYPGANAREAVTAMWQDAPHAKAPTLADYMEGCAWRAGQWNGALVRVDSPENFITDMVAAGLLETRRPS